MGPRGEVAKELALYLASGDGDTPQERAARSGALCTAVSRLLQELMDDQPGWDSRYTWLDGIAPLSIRRLVVRTASSSHPNPPPGPTFSRSSCQRS